MGKKIIIALLSCVFALCLALVGCGGGGGNNGQAAKEAFIGTWDLVEMTQGDEVTGADELETLKSLGLEVFVNLNQDDTAVLALFGEAIEGTWTASSTTDGTITLEGQEVSMSIADSKLTFEQEGATLTFQKGEAKEAPAAESSESASSSSEASESSSASSEASESESASSSESSSAAASEVEEPESVSVTESEASAASESSSSSESSSASESESSSSSSSAQ